MLAWSDERGDRVAVGWAQFGPISAYPRAQIIRERYPALPDSPGTLGRDLPPGRVRHRRPRGRSAQQLLAAVCEELDRRGIIAVEGYPEGVPDGWIPSPGPAAIYEATSFERVAGDDRFPVYRRELTGEGDEAGWDDLLRHTAPADDEDDWPFALPSPGEEDDLFRLPGRPRRPNPFGDD